MLELSFSQRSKKRNYYSLLIYVAVLLYLFSGLGCSSKPMPVKYKIVLDVQHFPESGPLKFFADNQEVMDINIDYKEGVVSNYYVASFEVNGYSSGNSYFKPSYVPKLVMRVPLPCGEKDVSLEVMNPSSRTIRKEIKNCIFELSDFYIKVPDFEEKKNYVRFYVDNRNGLSAEISLGQLKKRIASDYTGSFIFLGPNCEEGTTVKLNGESIGNIPFDKAPHSILIDTSGERCYKLSEVQYGQIWINDPRVALLQKKYLHFIFDDFGKINYWFEKAPRSITVTGKKSIGSIPSDPVGAIRVELLEIHCNDF